MWPGNGEGVMPLATWILGKSMYDGRLGIVQACVMSPYLVPHWLMWYFKHKYTRAHENPYDLIAPGIYLGRWPFFFKQFPNDHLTLIDLTCEFGVPYSAYDTRQYICLPCLDHCAPNYKGLAEIGELLANRHLDASASAVEEQVGGSSVRSLDLIGDGGARILGDVYIFCANGRGRSATLAAVVLVMRGECATLDLALAKIKEARPQVHIQAHQRKAAEDAIDFWVREGGSSRLKIRRESRMSQQGESGGVETQDPVIPDVSMLPLNPALIKIGRERSRSSSWGMREPTREKSSPRNQIASLDGRISRQATSSPNNKSSVASNNSSSSPRNGDAAAQPPSTVAIV